MGGSAGIDGSIKVWDVRNFRAAGVIPNAHNGAEVTSIQFSKTGK
eukprot:NODE_3258_length_686_cov_170.725275_g2318_i0.p9 GENE.NODE_3258_length_686_cov_170.725275_g2318_i0~~NODE_3258_length_686_cov_170.725275_g2318_i0.p9  ORF type:complete len:52 (+),score=20.31 NODE_3258_length_686_cov_170.725275_g2318_i0:23-157(+)